MQVTLCVCSRVRDSYVHFTIEFVCFTWLKMESKFSCEMELYY